MIEDVQVPYEILVRFGDDGAPQAAHVQYIRRVTMDGEVLKNEPLPAMPLTLDNFPECDLMTQTQLLALARINDLETDLATARAQIAGLEAAAESAA